MSKIKKWPLSLAMVALWLLLSGATPSFVQDEAQILTPATRLLIQEKNERYQKRHEPVRLIVKTVHRLTLKASKFKPAAKTVIIAVGQKGKKRNVRLFVSSDLKRILTPTFCDALIQSKVTALRSQDRTTFNDGLKFVFKACATKIDQAYSYPKDRQTDLDTDTMSQIEHPRRVTLPMALLIGVLVMVLLGWLKKQRQKG